jgi:hypothetical protein
LKLALEVFTELAKTLKQERDEAREKYATEATEHMLAVNKLATVLDDARQLADRLTALELQSTSELARLERERDEAREELHDIRLNLGADAEGYTLIHAVCVLQQERDEARVDRENSRQSLAFALEQLDEMRAALMEIEDLFIDGTDIYADREKMGMIARNALEETK